MSNIYFDETIAENIYNSACDMDKADYTETAGNDINLLKSAMDKIYSYASYNDDFMALYMALQVIHGNN